MKAQFAFTFLILYLITIPKLNAQINLVTNGNNIAGGFSSDNTFDFSVGELTTYTIETTNVKGNIGILQVPIEEITAVEKNNLTSIVLYPNPTSSDLKIDLPCQKNYDIYLHTIGGKIIKTYTSKSCLTNLDLSNLNQGVYLLKITNYKNSKTIKIIKQ